MKTRLRLLAIPVLLALAACRPGAAEYTEAEAPKALRVDRVSNQLTVAFAPGSAALSEADALRLHRMAQSGAVRAEDRVTIAVSGDPLLAEWRSAAIVRELLPYGIVATEKPMTGIGRDHAVVSVGRYMVTLPPCPNWSQLPASDFSNARSSNFGCSTATNLGLMVASPSDLVGGRDLARADAVPAVNAVARYLTDKVKLPESAAGAQALAASSGGTQPATPGAPGGTPPATPTQ
jgi:pilus assembly protein CpaD